MLIALALIFIALPIAEIYLFVLVGRAIGPLATVALVLAAMVLGAAVIALRAPRALGEARDALQRGEAPVREVLDGAVLVAAGALLIVPGFLTDAIGLLLLVPWVRRTLGYALLYRALAPRGPGRPEGVVEGDFRVVRDASDQPPPSPEPRLPPGPEAG
jgi:UPF0716 protein FxsA